MVYREIDFIGVYITSPEIYIAINQCPGHRHCFRNDLDSRLDIRNKDALAHGPEDIMHAWVLDQEILTPK